MKREGSAIDDGAVLDADVCVVGAGPAGLTLARALAANSTRVICLDSGSAEFAPDAQALNEGMVTGTPYAGLVETRRRQLGGTANSWNTPVGDGSGAKYVPLDPVDFEERAGVDFSGWPFDAAHLEAYYGAAQSACGLGRFSYSGQDWCAQRSTFPLPDPRVRAAIYQFGIATIFTRDHIDELESCDAVQLIEDATVCAIDMRSDSRCARAVDVATRGGRRFRVRARIFVLAAGAIENARLLLVSRQPGGGAPGNDHDWVGRCFMEHPRDRSMRLQIDGDEGFRRAAFYDRHASDAGVTICGRIALAAEIVREQALPNASVTLLPAVHEDGAARALLRRMTRYVPGAVVRRLRWGPVEGHGWSEVSRPSLAYAGLHLLINVEQFPDPANRVELDGARDAFGVPRVRVKWHWSARDHANLGRVRAVVSEALDSAGLGRAVAGADVGPDPNAHHHAGTTRMHVDARQGVVDAHGRVHGVDNLYVTGASVFPTAGFANPTLTIVALALRLAEHLSRRL